MIIHGKSLPQSSHTWYVDPHRKVHHSHILSIIWYVSLKSITKKPHDQYVMSVFVSAGIPSSYFLFLLCLLYYAVYVA